MLVELYLSLRCAGDSGCAEITAVWSQAPSRPAPHSMSMPIPRNRESTRLRFPLGGRVECHIGADWKAGYVVAHFYVQDTFPQGTCVPYQVQLDDGRLIFARLDEDSTIRREPDPVSSVPWLDPVLPQPENRRAVLGSLRSALAGVLIAFVLLQLADYLTTGAVSGRVRFVSADLVDAGGWLTPDGLGVAACAAAFASMGVQAWAGPDGTEWLNRAGIYSRAGAPDRAAALMHAALIAVGHETLLRGAPPLVETICRVPRLRTPPHLPAGCLPGLSPLLHAPQRAA